MATLRRLLLPAAFLLIMAGCTTPVQYEYNSAPYGFWHTFAWQAPEHIKVNNPIVDSGILATRVENAVVATLSNHGYRRVDEAENADFVVTYHTAVQNHMESSGPSFGITYGVGWWSYPFSTVIVSQPTYQVHEADLILDVINAETGKLVWRGWLTSSLSRNNYSQAAVNEAVARIFSKFPPPPKL
ncbi:MAG: DUF4136 domain-containing protein [Gammaproteobacteria bacterium]|nr:DUF4136 domain-containing protein [Gammaproteobacteria bacterium]